MQNLTPEPTGATQTEVVQDQIEQVLATQKGADERFRQLHSKVGFKMPGDNRADFASVPLYFSSLLTAAAMAESCSKSCIEFRSSKHPHARNSSMLVATWCQSCLCLHLPQVGEIEPRVEHFEEAAAAQRTAERTIRQLHSKVKFAQTRVAEAPCTAHSDAWSTAYAEVTAGSVSSC